MTIQRKSIIFLLLFCIIIIISTGCTYVTPDYGNYTVSYIRVNPSEAFVKINTSKKFEVKAYDSEDNLISINPTEVSWYFTFECPLCTNVGKINPENGSTSTNFTPYRVGKYFIYASYKGKSDNSPVQGTQ